MNDFGRLLEKEIPRLRRYAFALARNMSRADDLVQDTLVQGGCRCAISIALSAVEQVVNAAKEAASGDPESEVRAPAVAPPASASGDSVVEFPVVFDRSERPKSVREEPASADHLR
jgi:hypothetical protein